ncbi:MAG: exodeoxyribonuclease VII small subunit [Candidatus Aphodousia sp.]|nr:exodeoxyribonuclease VII small subunit [Sutterella sp.]MDY2900162.1 exodeoxyribonuclease VII small subunit [Candidatus Aphodousia sp.]
MSASKPIEKMTFEEAMQQMQDIVETMRRGELSLQDSVQAYQRGKALSARCEALLKEASEVVQKIEADNQARALTESDMREEVPF